MRVWIVNPFDPLPGEPERLGRYGLLARSLRRHGHAVTWVTSTFSHRFKRPRDRQAIYAACQREGIQVIFIPARPYRRNVSWRRLVNHAEFAAGVRAIRAGDRRAEVLLASAPPPTAADAARPLARHLSARLVLDTQDLWPESFYPLLPAALRIAGRMLFAGQHRAARRAACSADALTAVADGYLAHSRRLAARSVPAETFPLGIDLASFDAQADAVTPDQHFAKPAGQIWFVFGGGLSRNYDVVTLVEAARLAQAAWGQRVLVFLAGSGELAPRLRRRVAKLRLSNVHMPGFLQYARWANLLRSADASFLAVRSTSGSLLPNKFFDYLAGQTVILNTIRGQAEQILDQHRCGWTYAEGDSQACYQAMARVVEDPQGCQELALRGRELAETQFDHRLIYDRMARFLETFAEGPEPLDR